MATFNNTLLRANAPFLLAKRFRGKINIQRPRKPHFERQLLIDLSKPVYGPPRYTLPDIKLCDSLKSRTRKEIDNPFERILASECLNWFNTSKMIVFLHKNAISMEDKTPVFANLKKNNMHLRNYGRKIVSMATTGTRYEPVNVLFTAHQDIIFGQPETADKLFKILKKIPQMIVMAGIVHDKFMSRNELIEFSQLPHIDIVRSQLCAVLQSAGSSLVGQLNQSQQTLVSHLEKHVQINTDTDGNGDNK